VKHAIRPPARHHYRRYARFTFPTRIQKSGKRVHCPSPQCAMVVVTLGMWDSGGFDGDQTDEEVSGVLFLRRYDLDLAYRIRSNNQDEVLP
jgi:hypothetical protein